MYDLIPLKYQETEGVNDIGDNWWNPGKTAEINERVKHLGHC